MTGPTPLLIGWPLQVLAAATGFLLKPLHMSLTFGLLVASRRGTGRALAYVRLGLASFLVGETACAASFLLGNVLALDVLHDAGMVAFGALVSWGAAELLDGHVLFLTRSREHCAFDRLCQGCSKAGPAGCAAARMLLVGCALMAFISLIPISASAGARAATFRIFGSDVSYGPSAAQVLIEFRLLPVLACGALLVASALLARGHAGLRAAQVPFFAGLGLTTFSTFRFFLAEGFRAVPYWADFWEEATELGATLVIAWALWIFRRQLGLTRR